MMLTAVIYDEGERVAPLSRRIAQVWAGQGLAICGLVERQVARPDRRRCDMFVTELASGVEIPISYDRGALARGCTLDTDGLLQAGERVRAALAAGAERALFNKFGKSEVEGAGLRETIADAIAREVETIVFVPRRNIDGWRDFADGLAREVEIDAFELETVSSRADDEQVAAAA